MRIAVVDYHKGNLMNVERGLEAAGAEAFITDDPAALIGVDGIVLPGVGAFADASESLQALGLFEPLQEAAAAGTPLLGICLGLHLLYEEGEEGERLDEAGTLVRPRGLGILPGTVVHMPREDAQGVAYKVPHVGWNSLEVPGGGAAFESPLLEGIEPGEYFYFTHSYIAPTSEADIAHTTHSVTFPSAVQAGGNVFGVQFHPEKSSDAGATLLRNFVGIVERFRP